VSLDLLDRAPYFLYVILFTGGTYMILSSRNLLRAVVGLFLVQSSVVLVFILLSVRDDGTVPIVDPERTQTHHDPLPHALMLTAIVVGVATLGLAIALLQRQQAERRSIEDSGEEAPQP